MFSEGRKFSITAKILSIDLAINLWLSEIGAAGPAPITQPSS
jgi:hypothetical protein